MEMEESRRESGERVGGPDGREASADRGGEIVLQVEGGRPRFIRVAEGDLLWEGDRQPVPPTLREWAVERVDGRTVHVVDRRTGESRALDRVWVERQLAAGAMSTNLGDVECIRLREWPLPTGGTYLTVLAYADNGRTYVRRYRSVEGTSDTVELWTDDPETRWLSEAGRAALDRAVTRAIAATGLALRASA